MIRSILNTLPRTCIGFVELPYDKAPLPVQVLSWVEARKNLYIILRDENTNVIGVEPTKLASSRIMILPNDTRVMVVKLENLVLYLELAKLTKVDKKSIMLFFDAVLKNDLYFKTVKGAIYKASSVRYEYGKPVYTIHLTNKRSGPKVRKSNYVEIKDPDNFDVNDVLIVS